MKCYWLCIKSQAHNSTLANPSDLNNFLSLISVISFMLKVIFMTTFCFISLVKYKSAPYILVSTLFTFEGKRHIYASVNYTATGSDNGLLPGRCEAIIWTNAGILLIGPLRKNFNEILIENYIFSFKKMYSQTSGNLWPFCLSVNTGNTIGIYIMEVITELK